MSCFNYQNNQLYAEECSLAQIATQFGTPCYVYSTQAIKQNWYAYLTALKTKVIASRIFYAVKANSNLSILKLLSTLGAGFDVVSGGELERVLLAGGKAADIVFSGVGKNYTELCRAIDLGIHSINIESEAELLRISDIATQKNKFVNVCIRINPEVAVNSHPYITTGNKDNKFGISYHQAINVYNLALSLPKLKVNGISCHIGSQILSLAPFLAAVDQLLKIVDHLPDNGINIKYLNLGGGLGVCYHNENPIAPKQHIDAIIDKIKARNLELHLEPGRSIVATAGVLLTKVEYLKSTSSDNFAIVDAAMNDLMRPALYDSYHEVIPVIIPEQQIKKLQYNIVGPICESGDFLAKSRLLQLQQDDLLAINTCGAYGFSMSSNYNTRPRCAEILVAGSQASLIRKRETIKQVLENENLI